MKTAIAALLALGLIAGQANARIVFDDLGASAPRSEIFTDIKRRPRVAPSMTSATAHPARPSTRSATARPARTASTAPSKPARLEFVDCR